MNFEDHWHSTLATTALDHISFSSLDSTDQPEPPLGYVSPVLETIALTFFLRGL